MQESDLQLILESIQNDVEHIHQHLKAIAIRVMEEGISDYPVFIAAQEMVDLGRPILDRDSISVNWFFNASILEDFVRRDIVKKDKLEKFKSTFGDPREKACIFVLTPKIGQFIFVPYPEPEEEEEEDF
ncbi:MAG: hypothetical protein AAFR61_15615 [Bacteroidota bacterium]